CPPRPAPSRPRCGGSGDPGGGPATAPPPARSAGPESCRASVHRWTVPSRVLLLVPCERWLQLLPIGRSTGVYGRSRLAPARPALDPIAAGASAERPPPRSRFVEADGGEVVGGSWRLGVDELGPARSPVPAR